MDTVAIIFTPFSVRSRLVEKILSDINERISLSVYRRRFIKLEVVDVCILYPALITNPVFKLIVECLTSGNCELVIIKGENLYPNVKEIKGKFNCGYGKTVASGLRLKYQKDKSSFEFIFHSTDSSYEAEEIVRRFF